MDSYLEDQIINSMIDCGMDGCADDGGYDGSYVDGVRYNPVRYRKVVHATEKAILFELHDGGEQWVPRTACGSIGEDVFHVNTRFWIKNNRFLFSGGSK